MVFRRLDAVGDRFLNMAFEADPWDAALAALAEAAGALGVAVIPVKTRTPGPLPATRSFDSMVEAFVTEGWIDRDLRARAAPVAFRDGICDDGDCLSWEQMQKTEYFHEFLHRFELGPFAALGIATSEELYGVSIVRPADAPPFTAEQKAELAELRGKIAAGIELLGRLDSVRVQAVGDTLEAMREGAALLDRGGKVVRMNAAAEALLQRGLILRDGFLSSSNARNAAALHQHIAAAISPLTSAHHLAGRRFFIEREGRRPLILRAQRLTGPSWHYFSRAWGLAIFTDPEHAPPPDPILLASCFGLTPAEIAVVGELLNPGDEARTDARTIAAKLEISHHTVRAHIKSIFQKTNMRDRAALAALLARLS